MSIYKAYDIRGVVPDELDEDKAWRIGRALARRLGVDTFVVGHDVRNSREEMTAALARGINDEGTNVLEIGMVTTPILNWTVGRFLHGAGVMVTASHNPPEYNGFKVCRADAVPVFDRELKEVGADAEGEQPPAKAARGVCRKWDPREEYLRELMAALPKIEGRPKAVVDYANGAATVIAPRVIERVSCEATHLNDTPDGDFPAHEPNPLDEKNLEELRAAVLDRGADLGISYDGDADRVAFIDEKGTPLPGDIATLLLALELLRPDPKKTVLYDVRSSWAVKETLEKLGAKTGMCRVGHAFIKSAMRREGAFFAGELSGHFYFQDNFYAESSDFATVLMLSLLAREEKPLSRIVARYKTYHASGEINSKVEDKAAVLAGLEEKFGPVGRVFKVDGLSVEYDDWWFNVRPSNTEPFLRLNLEARERSVMEKKREEVLGVIRG